MRLVVASFIAALTALSICISVLATDPPKLPATVVPAFRDEHWRDRHRALVDAARQGGCELAFIGDSITEGWNDNGREIWIKRYAPRHAINLGISGDRTQHVLWRLDHNLLEALAAATPSDIKPDNNIKAVVLMIGTNNSNGDDHTAEEIAEGIKAIVAKLHTKLPRAKILLLAIFPRGEKPDAQREKIAKASQLAATIADGKSIHYLDLAPKFVDADGTLSPQIMPDYLHLSRKGYEVWADAMEEKLAELMGETARDDPVRSQEAG